MSPSVRGCSQDQSGHISPAKNGAEEGCRPCLPLPLFSSFITFMLSTSVGLRIQHFLLKTSSREAMRIFSLKLSILARGTAVTVIPLREIRANIAAQTWLHLLASGKYLDQEGLSFFSSRRAWILNSWCIFLASSIQSAFSPLFYSNSDFKNWKVCGVNFIGDLSESYYCKSFQDFKQLKIQFSLPNTVFFLIKYNIGSFSFIEIWIHHA